MSILFCSKYPIIESLLGYECEYADECDEGFVCAEGEGLDYMTCQCPPGFSLSSDEFSCNGEIFELISSIASSPVNGCIL